MTITTPSSFQQYVEKVNAFLERHPSLSLLNLEFAHTAHGNYLFDSLSYGGSVSRRSNIFQLCYESAHAVLLEHLAKRSQNFVDVGANIGLYSIDLSPFVEKVYACEPSTPLVTVLKANVEISGLSNVSVHSVAFSDSSAPVDYKNNSVWSDSKDRFSSVTFDAFLEEQSIPKESLLIKVDVDGFESKVFSGMKDFFHNKPKAFDLLLEVTPTAIRRFGGSPEKLCDALDQLNLHTSYLIPFDGKASALTGHGGATLYLNSVPVGALIPLHSFHELLNKQLSPFLSLSKDNYCLLSTHQLTDIHVNNEFLEKKQRVQQAIQKKTSVDEIKNLIDSLNNPFFKDQWQRYHAITHQVTSLKREITCL